MSKTNIEAIIMLGYKTSMQCVIINLNATKQFLLHGCYPGKLPSDWMEFSSWQDLLWRGGEGGRGCRTPQKWTFWTSTLSTKNIIFGPLCGQKWLFCKIWRGCITHPSPPWLRFQLFLFFIQERWLGVWHDHSSQS